MVLLEKFVNQTLQDDDAFGSGEMAINPSAGDIAFFRQVPPGFNFNLFAIVFALVDNGTCRADRFGSGAALVNGVDVEIISPTGDVRNFVNAKRNGDFAILGDFSETGDGRGWGCFFDCGRLAGGDPITLTPGSIVQVVIRDDISGILHFNAVIYGTIDSTSINLSVF